MLRARRSTVEVISSLQRPKPAPTDRITFERRIYSVDASVTHVLSEDDRDLHVVLEAGQASSAILLSSSAIRTSKSRSFDR
jgi:hypothetical protein